MTWVPMPKLATLLRNSRSGSSTSLCFFSADRVYRKNHNRNSTPMATSIQTGDSDPLGITTVPLMVRSCRDLPKPYVLDCSSPSTTKNSPAADSTDPVTSKRGRGPVGAGSLIVRESQMIEATSRTCRPNDARQLIALVTTPPISGPAAAPRPPAPLTMPKYRALDFTSGKDAVTRM